MYWWSVGLVHDLFVAAEGAGFDASMEGNEWRELITHANDLCVCCNFRGTFGIVILIATNISIPSLSQTRLPGW